jgi:hypothetical protein
MCNWGQPPTPKKAEISCNRPQGELARPLGVIFATLSLRLTKNVWRKWYKVALWHFGTLGMERPTNSPATPCLHFHTAKAKTKASVKESCPVPNIHLAPDQPESLLGCPSTLCEWRVHFPMNLKLSYHPWCPQQFSPLWPTYTSRKHSKKEPQLFSHCGSLDHLDLQLVNDCKLVCLVYQLKLWEYGDF